FPADDSHRARRFLCGVPGGGGGARIERISNGSHQDFREFTWLPDRALNQHRITRESVRRRGERKRQGGGGGGGDEHGRASRIRGGPDLTVLQSGHSPVSDFA